MSLFIFHLFTYILHCQVYLIWWTFTPHFLRTIFLARSTSFWHEVFVLPNLVILFCAQEPRFESLFGMSVLLVKKVISYKTDVTNYMCNFPVWISISLDFSVRHSSSCREHGARCIHMSVGCLRGVCSHVGCHVKAHISTALDAVLRHAASNAKQPYGRVRAAWLLSTRNRSPVYLCAHLLAFYTTLCK